MSYEKNWKFHINPGGEEFKRALANYHPTPTTQAAPGQTGPTARVVNTQAGQTNPSAPSPSAPKASRQVYCPYCGMAALLCPLRAMPQSGRLHNKHVFCEDCGETIDSCICPTPPSTLHCAACAGAKNQKHTCQPSQPPQSLALCGVCGYIYDPTRRSTCPYCANRCTCTQGQPLCPTCQKAPGIPTSKAMVGKCACAPGQPTCNYCLSVLVKAAAPSGLPPPSLPPPTVATQPQPQAAPTTPPTTPPSQPPATTTAKTKVTKPGTIDYSDWADDLDCL